MDASSDTTRITQLSISKQQLKKSKENLSFLEKKKRIKFKPFKPREIQSFNYNFKWIRYLLIGIISILTLLLLINIYYNNNNGRKILNISSDPLDIEDIQAVDLSAMLQTALNNEDYRLALRLKFLIILRDLENKKYIKWNKYKTNRTYIKEVPVQYKNHFREIAFTFDRLWYGNQNILKGEYNLLSTRFDQFKDVI